jgi:hypothetical protein
MFVTAEAKPALLDDMTPRQKDMHQYTMSVILNEQKVAALIQPFHSLLQKHHQ